MTARNVACVRIGVCVAAMNVVRVRAGAYGKFGHFGHALDSRIENITNTNRMSRGQNGHIGQETPQNERKLGHGLDRW